MKEGNLMKKKILAMTLILILIVTGCGSGSAAQDPDPNQVKVSNQEKGEKGTDKIVGVADSKDVSGEAGNQEVKDSGKSDGFESTQAPDSKKDTTSPGKSDSSTKTEKPGSASSDANKGSSTDSSGAGSSETTGKPGSTNSDKSAGTSSGSSEASGGQACKHKWVEETKTVNHEATGHYETQVVKEAWDEPVYEYRLVCNKCQTIFTNEVEEPIDDIDYHYAFKCDGSYSSKRVQTGTISHAAETKQVWVVDKAAWTETVGTGKYKCSLCGKAK